MTFGIQVFDSAGNLQMALTGSAYKLNAVYSFVVPPPTSWPVRFSYFYYPKTISAPQITNPAEWDVVWIPKIVNYSGVYVAPWPWFVTLSVGQINLEMTMNGAGIYASSFTQKIHLVKKT